MAEARTKGADQSTNPKLYTEIDWRAVHVPHTENRKLVRYATTYKKTKNGNILWSTGECVESAGVIIPVNEIHAVIAELAGALNAEREEQS